MIPGADDTFHRRRDVLNQMRNLRTFDAEDNVLIGKPVVSLEGLDKLESYRVSVNRLTGTIPSSIANARSLTELWVASNMLVGTIPTEIGLLTGLGM